MRVIRGIDHAIVTFLIFYIEKIDKLFAFILKIKYLCTLYGKRLKTKG